MRTVGRFALRRRQFAPRSSVTKSPVSVPTYSTSRLRVSSVTVRTFSPASPFTMALNVAP